jgi:hypothetical protein
MDVGERRNSFQAQGALLALHCHILASGPTPVSIWFLFALCMGQKAMLIPNLDQYIAALDPVTFKCLGPWLTFKPDDILPTNLLHRFNQFLITVMDIQVITLSTLAAVDLNCYSPLLFKVPVRQKTTMDGP